jgi:hypothetical protein
VVWICSGEEEEGEMIFVQYAFKIKSNVDLFVCVNMSFNQLTYHFADDPVTSNY